MGSDAPRLAVQRFVQAAQRRAHGAPKLAAALGPLMEDPPSENSIRSWANGHRAERVRADALFAIVRAFPDLSLDEFAMGEGKRASLQAQLDDLSRRLGALQAALDERLSDMGLEPLEVPEGA